MKNAITPAISSGNQPPSNSFSELAEKNTRSITRNRPLTANTSGKLKPHWIATSAARNVVIAISNDTAIPYAPASASADPKTTTAPTVAAASSQLTAGT